MVVSPPVLDDSAILAKRIFPLVGLDSTGRNDVEISAIVSPLCPHPLTPYGPNKSSDVPYELAIRQQYETPFPWSCRIFMALHPSWICTGIVLMIPFCMHSFPVTPATSGPLCNPQIHCAFLSKKLPSKEKTETVCAGRLRTRGIYMCSREMTTLRA